MKPVLDFGSQLMDRKITVKKIISETEFVVWHEELRSNLVMKLIDLDENLIRWIRLPPHSNIVTCFDTFNHVEGEEEMHFSLTEACNGGDMFSHIESLNLNLGINIPLSYMDMIYDCMIQLTLAIEYAHNNMCPHGKFGLQNVMLSYDGDTPIYKISNFCPGSSQKLAVSKESNFWPFVANKTRMSERGKLEILMLKDIYSLGIVLLELMIGRHEKKKFSISLDSLPLTWAEYAESTPLIQVLMECI